MDSFRPAFEELDLHLTEICWDDADVDWSRFDAVIIGTTWDYWDRSELFLETLRQIESQTRLFNSSELVRWNSDKKYLLEFANRDVKLLSLIHI